MANVTVACSVPGGLVLGLDEWNNPVKLNGPPSGGAANLGQNRGFGFSDVDATFYASWAASPAAAPILVAGAVWET